MSAPKPRQIAATTSPTASASTAAPWLRGEPPYDTHIFGADGFEVADVEDGDALHRDYYAGSMGPEHWATTPGAFITRGEDEAAANAALISAAPDLYTQLVGAVAVADVLVRCLGLDSDRTNLQIAANGEGIATVTLSALLDNARAAIAKAEGR